MNTKDLIAKLHAAAKAVSYYNAAEGQSWYKEATERYQAYAVYRKIVEECQAAGIDVEAAVKGKGYLL